MGQVTQVSLELFCVDSSFWGIENGRRGTTCVDKFYAGEIVIHLVVIINMLQHPYLSCRQQFGCLMRKFLNLVQIPKQNL